MDGEMTTLERIYASAKKEFLEKGFQGASLRNIVKSAGVTTGAFYGYYDSKEKLFDALVSEKYEHLMDMYVRTQNGFKKLEPGAQQENMGKVGGDCMEQMLDYMYENEDEFRLILTCSEGTRYENMVHEMSEIEVQATHDFVELMRKNGNDIRQIIGGYHLFLVSQFDNTIRNLTHRLVIEINTQRLQILQNIGFTRELTQRILPYSTKTFG